MSALPLLITHDDLLLDDLLRLAAAAGTTLDVAHDPVAALRSWSAASVVLLGADQAASVAEQSPPRRSDVHVVARAPADDLLFRSALVAGAADVAELPAADDWVVELLTDAVDGRARGALLVGVLAGSGGAGATTFACALALTAAVEAPALVVDLDPLGPGLDRVVGLEPDGLRWDGLVGSHGRLGSRSLRSALPTAGQLAVLTWGAGATPVLEPPSVREVLSAGARGHDVVVVDLPRHLDDVVAEVVTRCEAVLMVVEPTVPGVASAARLAAALRPLTDGLEVAVRTGGASLPADEVATALDLPLVAELPRQRRLPEQVDLGLGPVHSRRSPLAKAARSVLAVHGVARLR